MSNKVLLYRSTATSSGLPSAPDELDYGELAINYKEGKETLFILNDNDNIVSFSSDNILVNYIDLKCDDIESEIESNELVVSAALNDLHTNLENILANYWSKSELGILTNNEIQEIWDSVFDDD